MKLRNLYLVITLLILCYSCKNADKFTDVIYMTGTEQDVTTRFSIDGPASIGVSATSSKKVESDITVSFNVANHLIESYNKENGTNYKPLPENAYALSAQQSVMKSGSNVTEPIMFSILNLDDFEEGITYMAPISIAGIEGELDVLESARTSYVVINRTIITHAASLNANSFSIPKFAEDANLQSVPVITMETRIYVNRFQYSDPYISSVMGIENSENFLLRFGDVVIKPNQLQLTAKDQVTTNLEFSEKRWYHIAIVFDGNTIKIYVDGQLDISKESTRGPVNLYDGGTFHIGYSYNGRYLNGAISECRVWTKALTQADLQNNMCYVDPASDGLLAYWRFNEGSGNVSKDATGHGYDAISRGNVSWVSGVRCPE